MPERKTRRILKGTVVSDGMSKTRVIEVTRSLRHNLYQKNLRKSSTHLIHDEENKSKVGDVVLAVETRPLSQRKNFRLFKILSGEKKQ